MSSDTNENDSSENDMSETQMCLGNLDYIDSILSKLETTNDNEALSKTIKADTNLVEISKSPLLTNSVCKSSSVLRKTKSMTLTTSNKAHSTPKMVLSKELESLFNMYNDGSFNDSQTDISIDTNIDALKKIETYEIKSCKVSPIMTSQARGILRQMSDKMNSNPLSQETPISLQSQNKRNVRFGLSSELDNINRNLEYDDEPKYVLEKRSIKRLESVQEDEELLAHLDELEKKIPQNNNNLIVEPTIIKQDETLLKVEMSSNNLLQNYKTTVHKVNTIKKVTCENGQQNMNKINIDDNASMKPNLFVGFQTASKKIIPIKEDSLTNAIKILDEKELNLLNEAPKNIQVGFKTASEKIIPIKGDSLTNAIKILDAKEYDDDEDYEMKLLNNPLNIQADFKTASEKNISLKTDTINATKNFLEDEQISNVTLGFNTANENAITVKLNSINKNTNTALKGEEEDINESKRINISFNTSNIESQNRLSMNSTGISINKENFLDNSSYLNSSKLDISINSSKLSTNNRKTFKKPQLIVRSKLNKYIDSTDPTNETIADQAEELITSISSPIEIDNPDDLSKQNSCVLSNELHQNQFFLSGSPNGPILKLKEMNIEKTPDGFYILKPIFELRNIDSKFVRIENCLIQSQNSIDQNIEDKFLISSLNARSKLMKRLEAKKSITLSTSERARPGFLFEMKANKINPRYKLNQLIANNNQNGSAFDISMLKFDFRDFFSLNQLDEIEFGYIKTPDNGWLISDEYFQIGEIELFNCFLDTKGVDSRLINIEWFRNHLRWIGWKLFSYESRFKNSFAETRVFSPLNVLLQMKYRYDVEVGRARRSCIKKIIEKDDASTNKLIILLVSNIFEEKSASSSNLAFVELSDGWYPIKALCDTHLTALVKNNKIKIGDKLALFSCDLIGCPKDGCPPLEAPQEMHLKLSVNSVRKAKWFAKLGFVNPQRPLSVRLDTLKPNSLVGAIDVIIERIYAISYVETTTDGAKVYRNQKQEEMYQLNCDKKQYDKEDSKEVDQGSVNKSIKQTPIRRNVSEYLKIRVVDAKNNAEKQNISCLITIWQNATSLREQLVEGQRLVFMNLNAISPKNNFQEVSSIQLSTTRQTSFIFYKNKKAFISNRSNCEYKDIYEQKIKYFYNEIDICGIVVMHSMNSYQNLVYMTNLKESSSVVCICFPKQSEFYGFKDVLAYSNTIACLNLKFIRKKENNKYPCLLATENSIFTQKSSLYKYLTNEFNLLNKTNSKNLACALEQIQDEIANSKLELNGINSAKTVTSLNKTPNLTGFSKNSQNKGLSRPNSSLNDSMSNEKKMQAIAEIVEIADTNVYITKNGTKQPGLAKSKFNAPKVLTKEGFDRSLVLTTNCSKSLKRNSLCIEPECRIDLENHEDDEEAQLMINQDFEALCKNQFNKRKKI